MLATGACAPLEPPLAEPGRLSQALSSNWLEDDFEAGSRPPLSDWSDHGAASGVTVGVDAAAAHRGALGLRLVDAHAGSGSNVEGYVAMTVPQPSSATCYLRTWLRTTPGSGGGDVMPSEIETTPASATSGVYDFALTAPAMDLSARGFDALGNYATDGTVTSTTALWHLVELALTGVGTAQGSRTLWVDGARAVSAAHDFSGLRLGSVALGEPWADAAAVTLTLDFDDARIGPAPPASTLTAAATAPLKVGGCARFTVDLKDSAGAAAAAPYDVDASLSLGGAALSVFSDEGCAQAAPSLRVPSGASSASGSFRPSRAGSLPFVATHLDFLSAPTQVDVTDEAPLALRGFGCSSASASPLPLGVAMAALAIRRRRAAR
jgi:hypothetical protein